MGKYDNMDKDYFGEPERFAELVTNGVYHGKVRTRAEELEMLTGDYPSLASASGEMKRDKLFLCENHGVKYGLEIENYPDYGMPRRVLSYDACEYEKEARELRDRHEKARDLKSFAERKNGMTPDEGYFPVITVALYLGQGHFSGRTTLRECFHVPKRLVPFVHEKIQNYTFPLIEADYVNPEDYKTELRYFFQAMQSRYDKKKLNQLFDREEFQNLSTQTQKVIALHLGVKELKRKVIREEENMCKAYRDLVKDWKQEGRQEGRWEGLLFAVRNLMSTSGMSMEQAMDMLKITGEDRRKCLDRGVPQES